MAKQNQGFRKDLNLQENENDTTTLSNIGGAGIANDLRIIQNNLRNTSTLSFNSVVGAAISNGYFYFGPTSNFVYTNDDIVSIKKNITVGVGVTLYKDSTYYICNSNNIDSFKLSTSPSTVGVNTVTVSFIPPPSDIYFTVNRVIVGSSGTGYTGLSTTVTISSPETSWGIAATAVAQVNNGSVVAINVTSSGRGYLSAPTITIAPPSIGINTATATLELTTNLYTLIDFIRKDPVYQENLVNFIEPDIQDTENFSYIGIDPKTFDAVQGNDDSANYLIGSKYKKNQNVTTKNDDLKYEGSVVINDPANLNVNTSGLNNEKSPGVFIGDTRAFSSDNNPWTQVGTALSTTSNLVSVGELYFANGIGISGVGTESASRIAVTSFTHKLPVVVNGETYYLLLRT